MRSSSYQAKPWRAEPGSSSQVSRPLEFSWPQAVFSLAHVALLVPLAEEAGSVVLLSQPVTIYDWEWQNAGNLTVSFGIERFYVPEGEGRPIEDGRNQGRVSVAVRVSEDGQAQIRALMLDNEPLYEEPLY